MNRSMMQFQEEIFFLWSGDKGVCLQGTGSFGSVWWHTVKADLINSSS